MVCLLACFLKNCPIPDREAAASGAELPVHCNCNVHAACHPVESPDRLGNKKTERLKNESINALQGAGKTAKS